MALHGPHNNVIDLVSDSEDEVEFLDAWDGEGRDMYGIDVDDDQFLQELLLEQLEDRNAVNAGAGNDGYENPIVLDDDIPANELGQEPQKLSAEQCLQTITNVLPDISIDYALGLIVEQTTDETRGSADCERLIALLLDQGAYPKEADEVNKRKRKRESRDTDEEDIEDAATDDPEYLKDATDLLKEEFLYAPIPHIKNTLAKETTLLKTFLVIEEQLRVYDRSSSRSIRKIQKPRTPIGFAALLAHKPIVKELEAARARVAKGAAKRQEEQQQKLVEEQNIERAKQHNEMNDCLCCYDEFPLNRMVSCDGDHVHLFCRDCARKYVEEEMSKSRCRPVCFADPDCGGTFSRQQLLLFLCSKSFERLEHLQQQEDIAAAGLENLSECPFCDFKQECPPVEIDREFRCLNPQCGKTSCRHCDTETHIPKTCEEAKKDKNITVRHTLEEAKSEALIRNCNKCKSPFVKDEGCNKMTCPKCHNVQCYVCSKNVTNYDHFGSPQNRNRCPLHDNVEKRHEDEVKKAEADALAKIRAEHPDIPEEELQIKVSDAVQASERNRQGRAEARHNGFGVHMHGPHLVRAQRPRVFPFPGADDPHHMPLPYLGGRIPPPPPMPGMGPVPYPDALGPEIGALRERLRNYGVGAQGQQENLVYPPRFADFGPRANDNANPPNPLFEQPNPAPRWNDFEPVDPAQFLFPRDHLFAQPNPAPRENRPEPGNPAHFMLPIGADLPRQRPDAEAGLQFQRQLEQVEQQREARGEDLRLANLHRRLQIANEDLENRLLEQQEGNLLALRQQLRLDREGQRDAERNRVRELRDTARRQRELRDAELRDMEPLQRLARDRVDGAMARRAQRRGQ